MIRDFARRFVEWNDIIYGIQRVDACRTCEGELLLVELDPPTWDVYIGDFIFALDEIF